MAQFKLLKHKYLAWWLECSPMARETWVQSQVESYRRLKKWYLMPPCWTPRIISYGSKIKWSNPEKGLVPSLTPWCSSYRKGSIQLSLDYGRQLYLLCYSFIWVAFKSYNEWINRQCLSVLTTMILSYALNSLCHGIYGPQYWTYLAFYKTDIRRISPRCQKLHWYKGLFFIGKNSY